MTAISRKDIDAAVSQFRAILENWEKQPAAEFSVVNKVWVEMYNEPRKEDQH